MIYSVIKVINGNYFIHAEGITKIDNAIVIYHDVCKTLWDATDVNSACVIIANEQMDIVNGYKEVINKK